MKQFLMGTSSLYPSYWLYRHLIFQRMLAMGEGVK